MKNRIILSLVLVLIFALFSSPSKGYAKSGISETEGAYSKKDINSINDCAPKNKNTQSPCVAVVFSNVVIDLSSSLDLTPLAAGDLTQVVTCGVNIYNGAGAHVATLSETVYARWNYTTHYVDNATRYSWVVGAPYGWTNLTGPSPKTGWGQFNNNPIVVNTTGKNTWILGSPMSHLARTTISGTRAGTYPPYWSCSGSY